MTFVEIDLNTNSVLVEPGAPLSVKLTDVSDVQVIQPGGPPGPQGPPGVAGAGAAVPMVKVSTYYSYPTSVNGSAGKLDAAASAALVFAAYDEVIFGAGLQDPGHIVYEQTRRVIELLKGYGTRVWGYIDTEAVPGNDLAGVTAKISDWKAIGAGGIFCDKFGFDYGTPPTTRARQNEVIDAIHAAGLPAIVNVWNMADAFDPSFGAVHVGAGDVLYLESFTANTEAYLAAGSGGYATLSDMKARADTAHGYQVTYGFDIWVSNIVERAGLPELDRLNFFRQCEAAARIFRADGMTIDSGYYSSAFADSATVDQFTYSFDIGEPIHRDAPWEMSPDWHAISAGDLGLSMHHYVGEGYTVTETEPQEVEHIKISGGTMYGPLVLAGDPVATLEAATKGYVDTHGGTGGGGGVTDHGALTGLADNDHPQYLLKTGGTMTGALVVPDPVADGDAVNKAWALANPGPIGPPGTSYLYAQWNFNQNTVVSPASGTMRMNATTYAATTLLWVAELDRDGLNRAAGLDQAVVGDQIIMQSGQGRAVWNITAHADSGTYRTFTVTLAEGAGSRPSASAVVTLYFVSAGGSTGLDLATADGRYVNVTGDTMSGRLVAGEVETRNVRNDGILVYPWGDASAQGAIVPVVAGTPQTFSGLLYYGGQWHSGTALALPGDPVAGTDAATKSYVDTHAAGGGTAGHAIHDEGAAALTQRAGLNFVGAGVTVTDDSGGNKTTVTIPGGGSGATGPAGGDLSGTYPDPQIAAGAIVDNDINGSAAIAQSKISGLPAALTARELTANKGAASGYASLDAGTKVPIGQVPTGTTSTTVALGNHTHAGVYDPAGTAASAVSTHAATAGHEPLSTTTPAALGTAAVGTGTTTARADHVHAMPTAADVGAATTAYVDARTPKITVATSAPSSPAVNDLWVNST